VCFVAKDTDRHSNASVDQYGKEPWVFAPTCSLRAVAEFQAQHQIQLPQDYVRFITEVGNGATSDGTFAVFSVGMTVDADGYGPPIPFTPPVPDALSRTFAHGLGIWSGDDGEDEINDYLEDHGERPQMFDGEILPGALPIADQGCGEWCYLAVTGPLAGTVWELSNGWLLPAPTQWLRPVNFTQWIVGQVALPRGLVAEFRQLTDVVPKAS
jgi:hypothetical protein